MNTLSVIALALGAVSYLGTEWYARRQIRAMRTTLRELAADRAGYKAELLQLLADALREDVHDVGSGLARSQARERRPARAREETPDNDHQETP